MSFLFCTAAILDLPTLGFYVQCDFVLFLALTAYVLFNKAILNLQTWCHFLRTKMVGPGSRLVLTITIANGSSKSQSLYNTVFYALSSKKEFKRYGQCYGRTRKHF